MIMYYQGRINLDLVQADVVSSHIGNLPSVSYTEQIRMIELFEELKWMQKEIADRKALLAKLRSGIKKMQELLDKISSLENK